jgi:hypothetical protein
LTSARHRRRHSSLSLFSLSLSLSIDRSIESSDFSVRSLSRDRRRTEICSCFLLL